jgi:phosphatidylglycerophosphatase C
LQVINRPETFSTVAHPNDPNASRGIALFDLDGTLLAWDCQLLFCHRVLRRAPWRRFYLPVFLMLLPAVKVLGAGGMKRVFLSYLWRMEPDELASHARAFAHELTFFPEVVARLDAHRKAGDLLVLASASPEFYVREIGHRLGFDLSLGTPVETSPRMAFFPELENHKGSAKVDRLLDLMPERFENGVLRKSHGYTDSTADLPMLAICEMATLVNPSAELTALGIAHGWEVIRPERPWRSAIGRALRILALMTGLGRNPGKL